jgi:hypothetical protein
MTADIATGIWDFVQLADSETLREGELETHAWKNLPVLKFHDIVRCDASKAGRDSICQPISVKPSITLILVLTYLNLSNTTPVCD